MVGMAPAVPYITTPHDAITRTTAVPMSLSRGAVGSCSPAGTHVMRSRGSQHQPLVSMQNPPNVFILINGYFPFKSNVSHIAD